MRGSLSDSVSTAERRRHDSSLVSKMQAESRQADAKAAWPPLRCVTPSTSPHLPLVCPLRQAQALQAKLELEQKEEEARQAQAEADKMTIAAAAAAAKEKMIEREEREAAEEAAKKEALLAEEKRRVEEKEKEEMAAIQAEKEAQVNGHTLTSAVIVCMRECCLACDPISC